MTFRGTTIVGVRKNGKCAIAGDGQVTLGEHTIFKAGAVKVRRLFGGKVAIGFAGSVADAFTLSERFEEKLKQYAGNLERAAVELTQDWRDDKVLRKLEAMMIAANEDEMLILSGTGEVLSPDDGVCAIGSGGNFALAAARALTKHTGMSAAEIARESLVVASSICVYTNENITVLEV